MPIIYAFTRKQLAKALKRSVLTLTLTQVLTLTLTLTPTNPDPNPDPNRDPNRDPDPDPDPNPNPNPNPHQVGRGLKAFEREIKELNLDLFPEALAHAVRLATRTLPPTLALNRILVPTLT